MQLLRRHLPRTVHGVTLVSGGVIAGLSYELLSRPFDIARRFVQEDRLLPTQKQHSAAIALMNRIKQDGILIFFNGFSSGSAASTSGSIGNRRLYVMLRTLARVGPWGVGFLVWEAFHNITQISPNDSGVIRFGSIDLQIALHGTTGIFAKKYCPWNMHHINIVPFSGGLDIKPR